MFLMQRIAIQAAAVSLLVASTAHVAQAEPVTKEACISSNEAAQVARKKGELRAAREQLLVCIADGCPGPIRDDCKERLAEVERAAPTIVVTAKDSAGNVLTAVTVHVDDKPLAEKLDGTALVVDPGEHVFRLTASGRPAVTRKVVLREGEKGHTEEIAFPLAGALASSAPVVAPVATAEPPPVDPPRAEPAAEPDAGGTQRTVGYILGGAGLVGIGIGTVFGFVSKSTYDEATKSCPLGVPLCNDAGVTGGEDAHGQATVSTAAFIVGGVLLGAGLVTFFTAPKRAGISIQPTASSGSAGIRIGGPW